MKSVIITPAERTGFDRVPVPFPLAVAGHLANECRALPDGGQRVLVSAAELIHIRSRRRLAAPLARRQRRALPWEARPAHAGPLPQRAQINVATRHADQHCARRAAIFLTFDCPARSHRLKGGPPGVAHAIGYRRLLTRRPLPWSGAPARKSSQAESLAAGMPGDRDRGLSLKHHVPALASLVDDGPPWYLRCLKGPSEWRTGDGGHIRRAAGGRG